MSLTSPPPPRPNTPTPNKIPKTNPVSPINPKIPQQKHEGEKNPLFCGGTGPEKFWFVTGLLSWDWTTGGGAW